VSNDFRVTYRLVLSSESLRFQAEKLQLRALTGSKRSDLFAGNAGRSGSVLFDLSASNKVCEVR
jgi:hypothetical protein